MRYEELLQCQSAFDQFCRRYEKLFPRKDQRMYLEPYLRGLLGPLERKSIEPIALEQGVDVRLLQRFIGGSTWQDEPFLREHRRHVCETLGSPYAVLILDSTSFPKRGDQSVGVARQWCGQRGKEENCQVCVNLSYASPLGHTFLDRRLYLPRGWSADGVRRRLCGIPPEVAFRTSGQLANEMICTARSQEVPHAWITGDEEFGKVPWLHDDLDQQQQRYIFEVPVRTRVWLTLPKGRRRGPKGLLERLSEIGPGRPALMRVDQVVQRLPQRAYRSVRVRDASKGPIEVLAVRLRVRFHRGAKKARPQGWLIISETLDQRRQRKFFVSNAEPTCSFSSMLQAGYARWPIEQDHGQGKNETGLGHYETRSWLGWHHHTALSFLAHHFLVLQRNRLGEKISRNDCRGDPSRILRGVLQSWPVDPPAVVAYAVSPTSQPRSTSRPLEKGIGVPCPAGDTSARRCPACQRDPYWRLN